MLQSAGAHVSSWAVLEALLEPNEERFRFLEPLGIAREVKVAASGLFGRFVARAYLERYMKLSVFAHIGQMPMVLDGHSAIEVRRRPGKRGDLPDWVACASSLTNLTIAEAKGCHERRGPGKTLERAWDQVGRVNVHGRGGRLAVKRVAVVTRWASKSGGPATPIIAVRDPEEEGDPLCAGHGPEACFGLTRIHVANILVPLGYRELAAGIRQLGGTRSRRALVRSDEAIASTRRLLDRIRPRKVRGGALPEEAVDLVGAFVTRAGPISSDEITSDTAQRLRALNLRPMYVGIEREVIDAVISASADGVRKILEKRTAPQHGIITVDPSGIWLAEMDDGIRVM